ncbi:hypothetical protein PIB30_079565 [Stylosanthes scabra]|uniref:Reverse transcriptase domain-containing protein n=1 Tax=Stylosanthes scabra TaxID=79078 RepID=A0ABU6UQ33_9FABA|nr:hypothetical protein [Stylosanthes scabra]
MTQLSTINKKLEKLEASAAGTLIICGICGGPHENHNCISIQDDQFSAAQVNYVNNQPRPPYNDPHSNTYNPGQIAKQITEKSSNILPSDTITNPRQECKEITLRSGKTTGHDTQDQVSAEDSRSPPPKEKEEVAILPIPAEEEKKIKEPAVYIPKPPYPQRLKAETKTNNSLSS